MEQGSSQVDLLRSPRKYTPQQTTQVITLFYILFPLVFFLRVIL